MFEATSAWLISDESRTHDLAFVMEELARRLVAEGLPIWRLHVAVLAMHPEVFARSVRWTREKGATVVLSKQDLLHDPAYIGSPIEAVRNGLDRVRARIGAGELPYRQLIEVRNEGGTDYVAFALGLGERRRTFLSMISDAPGGFGDDALTAFEELLPALGIRLELESNRFSTETLLQLYLGKNAAARVLAGDFRRGTGQVIHAAIWMCDLRGFTSLSDRLALKEIVPVLDSYFEAVAGPVRDGGGEILKFIGDSMLAVFPTDGNVATACAKAVEAASAGIDRFGEIAYGLEVGVAVNLGDVMYGNVGASDRLDFTVIGPAVNETARMESMCKELKTPLVFSEPVSKNVAGSEPLGSHALRGVSGERPLFTLKRFAP